MIEENIMDLLFKVERDKKLFKSNLSYEDALKLQELLEKTIVE